MTKIVHETTDLSPKCTRMHQISYQISNFCLGANTPNTPRLPSIECSVETRGRAGTVKGGIGEGEERKWEEMGGAERVIDIAPSPSRLRRWLKITILTYFLFFSRSTRTHFSSSLQRPYVQCILAPEKSPLTLNIQSGPIKK